MEWNLVQQTPEPPAYLVERISDLKLAADTAKTSPSNARVLIRKVLNQLEQHNNTGRYFAPLARAEEVVLDSPFRARALINLAIDIMNSEKRAFDVEKSNPWKRILK